MDFLFPTSRLNCVGGNGEIFEDELQGLNQIVANTAPVDTKFQHDDD